MCMAIDAAVYISNKVIGIHNSENQEYSIDFFKVHKMLYLAQGIMLAVYGYPMFKEEISAHTCGVYVGGLDTFYEMVGTNIIKNKINNYTPLLTYDRKKVLDYVATRYGNVERDALIEQTKKHSIYMDTIAQAQPNKPKPVISQDSIRDFFVKNKDMLYQVF